MCASHDSGSDRRDTRSACAGRQRSRSPLRQLRCHSRRCHRSARWRRCTGCFRSRTSGLDSTGTLRSTGPAKRPIVGSVSPALRWCSPSHPCYPCSRGLRCTSRPEAGTRRLHTRSQDISASQADCGSRPRQLRCRSRRFRRTSSPWTDTCHCHSRSTPADIRCRDHFDKLRCRSSVASVTKNARPLTLNEKQQDRNQEPHGFKPVASLRWPATQETKETQNQKRRKRGSKKTGKRSALCSRQSPTGQPSAP